MSDVVQEILVGVIVVFAFVYLVRHLTGWPRRRVKGPKPESAVLGDRLAKGLKKAQEQAR